MIITIIIVIIMCSDVGVRKGWVREGGGEEESQTNMWSTTAGAF